MATAAAALVQLVAYGAAFLHPKLQPKLDSKLESKPDLKKGDQDFSTTWPKALCSPPVFCLALAAVLVAGRWEWLKVDRPLNPDEGLWLANAWRYTFDIVPWRATSSGTSGPLTPWLLTLLGFCGAPLDYATAHTVALGLQIAVVCLAYGTIRIVCGEASARLATMPVALLLGRTGHPDFVHLSSENVPLVLMAACGWAAAHGLQGGVAECRSKWWLVFAGVLAGAVPFAKLQAVPMALVMSCVIATAAVVASSSRQNRFARLISFGGGGCIVPIAILGMVWWAGVFGDMWHMYVDGCLAYGNSSASEENYAARVSYLIWESPVFLTLSATVVATTATAVIGCVVSGWGRTERFRRWLLFASAVYLATGLFCVAKPGHHFPHYLMLLTLPLMLLSGTALQVILSAQPKRLWSAVGAGLACIAPVVVLSQCGLRGSCFVEGVYYDRVLAALVQRPPTAEAGVVAELSDPDDEVAVWGAWRSDIYIEARRRPAVRDVELSGAIVPGPFRDYSRRRFLEDMQRNRPRLFVDAVCYAGFPADDWQVFGKEIVERRLGGHETFAELGEFVSRHYVRRAQVFKGPNGSGGSVRVYERRDAVPR
jgi:hypothetical protein